MCSAMEMTDLQPGRKSVGLCPSGALTKRSTGAIPTRSAPQSNSVSITFCVSVAIPFLLQSSASASAARINPRHATGSSPAPLGACRALESLSERQLVERRRRISRLRDHGDALGRTDGRADTAPKTAVQVQTGKIVFGHGQRLGRTAVDALRAG